MFGTLGNYLTFSSFGESHGEAYGGILTNFPAGVKIDFDEIQHQLSRRKPGQSAIVTQRKEADKVRFLSGIFEGKTTGMPIGFLVENENQKTKDYEHLASAYRPSHADYTYDQKFGFRDYRGGGRSSARETLNWVVAGTLAKYLLPEVEIYSYVSSVGEISCTKPYQELDFSKIDENEVRCPDETTAKLMIERIEQARKKGDTVGGTIICVIKNAPKGLGEPVFNKLHAELGKAMLGINACKGFEYGTGFEGAKMSGSAQNDIFNADGTTKTNHSGGIQGGISNGMDIYFRVAFKPVSTLMMPQESIDNVGNIIKLEGKGRHDPCVLPRAVPVVDALSAFVLADMYLIDKQRKI
ncbi:MAG: chorismate synthase [Flavobacteriaceae bacterium]|nr:chorismate synthase [Flavobacteriaceae bacterium]